MGIVCFGGSNHFVAVHIIQNNMQPEDNIYFVSEAKMTNPLTIVAGQDRKQLKKCMIRYIDEVFFYRQHLPYCILAPCCTSIVAFCTYV
jgi:hypothetical protein